MKRGRLDGGLEGAGDLIPPVGLREFFFYYIAVERRRRRGEEREMGSRGEEKRRRISQTSRKTRKE